MSQPALARRSNRKVALICLATFVAMVGAAYAAVPIYKVFCEATGFAGTVRRATDAPTSVANQSLTVRFDVNVRDLPWTFTTQQASQTQKIGETKLAVFRVTNNSDKPMTGRAVFNVVPVAAGAYFEKLQCFCFSNQTIGAHQTVDMPVLYFVDPKYAQDSETRDAHEVTLSYTFYPAVDAQKQADAKPVGEGAVSALGGTPKAGL